MKSEPNGLRRGDYQQIRSVSFTYCNLVAYKKKRGKVLFADKMENFSRKCMFFHIASECMREDSPPFPLLCAKPLQSPG